MLSKDLDIDKKYLKKIAETGGNLRLSLNSKQNYQSCENYKRAIEEGTISFKTDYLKNEELKKVKACIKLSNILNEGVSGILKYSKISKIYKTEDQSALESIINFIDAGLSLDIPLDEILNKAISISVSSKVSSEGSLYVTSISKAKSVIRKYLFVVGLSNDLYPGAAKDNCLFLDSDYKLFDENLEKSKQELSNKKDELISLLRLNCNNEIFISYPYYSCEDLKTKNPSSMIFEIFKSTNEGDSTLEDLVGGENKEGIIVKHNFFECSISNGRNIGKEYATNSNIISDFKTNIIPQKNDLNKLLNKSFSASQIDNFFRCPYRFYLETIIGFEDEFIVDPTESLDAASYGNILHESLENLNKNTQSKEDYLHIIEDLYKKYKISHPILSDELEEKDLLRLKDAGENAYKMASNNKLLVSEDDIKNIHVKSGISIHGFPDRAEIDNNGEVIVIDYKTKSHFDHDIDDPKTFGQILTYAYLVKLKYNRKISKVEYRYLKQGKSIYVEGKKLESFFDYFDEQLLKLKNCIEIGKFEKCIDCKDKYCPYYDLCLSSISMEDDSNE